MGQTNRLQWAAVSLSDQADPLPLCCCLVSGQHVEDAHRHTQKIHARTHTHPWLSSAFCSSKSAASKSVWLLPVWQKSRNQMFCFNINVSLDVSCPGLFCFSFITNSGGVSNVWYVTSAMFRESMNVPLLLFSMQTAAKQLYPHNISSSLNRCMSTALWHCYSAEALIQAIWTVQPIVTV